MARTATGRLISGVLFDIRSGARHPASMSECMSWFLPDLVGGGPPFALHRFVVDPVAPPCGGRAFVCRSDQSWPKVALHKISAERGDWSSPLRPVHPGDYCGIVAPAAIWDGTGPGRVSIGGLEQAELAGAGDRCGAVLSAQFAVEGALVGLHGVQ